MQCGVCLCRVCVCVVCVYDVCVWCVCLRCVCDIVCAFQRISINNNEARSNSRAKNEEAVEAEVD